MWKLDHPALKAEVNDISRGLPLFTATNPSIENGGNSGTMSLFQFNPLATYPSKVTAPVAVEKDSSEDFVPVVDSTTSLTLVSQGDFYVIDTQEIEFEGLTLVDLLDTEPMSFSHLDELTYLHLERNTPLGSLTSMLTVEVLCQELEEDLSNYQYRISLPDFTEVTIAYTDGLTFMESRGEISTSPSGLVTISASPFCHPQVTDPFSEITFIGNTDLSSYEKTKYTCLVFDFSEWDLDIVESLEYQNKTFINNGVVETFGMIFNTTTKQAMCFY